MAAEIAKLLGLISTGFGGIGYSQNTGQGFIFTLRGSEG